MLRMLTQPHRSSSTTFQRGTSSTPTLTSQTERITVGPICAWIRSWRASQSQRKDGIRFSSRLMAESTRNREWPGRHQTSKRTSLRKSSSQCSEKKRGSPCCVASICSPAFSLIQSVGFVMSQQVYLWVAFLFPPRRAEFLRVLLSWKGLGVWISSSLGSRQKPQVFRMWRTVELSQGGNCGSLAWCIQSCRHLRRSASAQAVEISHATVADPTTGCKSRPLQRILL